MFITIYMRIILFPVVSVGANIVYSFCHTPYPSVKIRSNKYKWDRRGIQIVKVISSLIAADSLHM